MSARAELEGWLVLNVGSREAEECLAIVERIIAEECAHVPVLQPDMLAGGIDRTPSSFWKNARAAGIAGIDRDEEDKP